MKKLFLFLALSAGACACQAVLSEPDNVVYGTITFGQGRVTATNTGIVIEARAQMNGAPVASYRMGSQRSAGDFYTLRLGLESLTPTANPATTFSGQIVYLVVYDADGVRAQATCAVGSRGQMIRVDLAGADPGQVMHPADNSPADNVLTMNEVLGYISAWRNGTSWPAEPNEIPLGYAVRAGALWRGGEEYRLDSTVNGPPAWWVNTASIGSSFDPSMASATAAIPTNFVPGSTFIITNTITPAPGSVAYGVEDQPPAGWRVFNISHNGYFDPASRKVKWGIFFDQSPRALTYQVTVPTNVASDIFMGEASFDGIYTLTFGNQHLGGVRPGLNVSMQYLASEKALRCSVQGSPGQTLVVENSSDLENWQILLTEKFDAFGNVTLTNFVGTNQQCFYRFQQTSQ